MHPHREEASRDRSRRVAKHAEAEDKVQDKAMIVRAFKEHDDQLHGGKKTKLKLRRGGRAKEVEGHDGKKRLDRASGGRTRHRDMGGAMPPTGPMAQNGQVSPQMMQQIRAAQAQRGMGMAPQGAAPNGMPPTAAKRGGRLKRAAGGRAMGGGMPMEMGGSKAKSKGKEGKAGNKVNVIVAPGGGGGAGPGAGGARPVPVPVPVRRSAPPPGAGGPPPGAAMPPPRPMPPPGMAGPGAGGPPMMPPPGGIKRGGRAKAHA